MISVNQIPNDSFLSMALKMPHPPMAHVPGATRTCCTSIMKMPGCTRSIVEETAAGPSFTMKVARKDTNPRTNFWVRDVWSLR